MVRFADGSTVRAEVRGEREGQGVPLPGRPSHELSHPGRGSHRRPVGDPGTGPHPELNPPPDLDTLLEMEDEIRSLSVQIHSATHRLLVVLAEFDRRRGWEVGGHRCCADWLSFHTGIDRGAARERVRAARALTTLPAIGEAMSQGRLSFSQVRALTRVATPETEDELLPLALENSTSRLERILRGWRRGNRRDEARWAEEIHQSRSLSVFPDEDGMYVVKGVLPAEVGLLLMRALDAASDALFREEGKTPPEVDPEASRAAAARRRADAMGLLAERAMAAGLTTEEGAPISGTRPERYQVVLHVDESVLGGAATALPHALRSHFDDGTRASAETCRRVCCDAAVVRVREAPDGEPLSVGRKTRVISPALRRALELRDGGCRFPGCNCRFTDAHHVQHWATGGETSLRNCLLLCHFHHRLVHEGGWSIRWWGKGRPVFIDPRGGERFDGGWQEGGAKGCRR